MSQHPDTEDTRATDAAHTAGVPLATPVGSPESVELETPDFNTLARYLLVRHLQVCLRDRHVRESFPAIKEVMDEHPEELRVVAVVGAGASAPFLRTGQEAIAALRHDALRHDPGFEEELRRLYHVFNAPPEDFENTLFALSRTRDGERRVRQLLSQFYRRRYPTQIAYELLAHLLKHRFIDAIVSFNFDELLDTSVSDELLDSEYRRIVSERDCSGVQANPDDPRYLPLLLKIHGTASDADSLRFTRDSYYALPDRIATLLKKILGNHSCVLLSVGFSMLSFDFT